MNFPNRFKILPTLLIAIFIVNKNWALSKNKPPGPSFIQNKGQFTDDSGNLIPQALFKVSFPGTDVWLTNMGITYVFIKAVAEEEEKSTFALRSNTGAPSPLGRDGVGLEWSRVDMLLKGAEIKAENIIKEFPQEGEFNYYLAHCPNGITGVKGYNKITIKEVYKGIDWVLYTNQSASPSPSERVGLKYDFVIHPGANIKDIAMVYNSADVSYNEKGGIVISTPVGKIEEQAPVCYEQKNKKNISGKFKIKNEKEVVFETGTHDALETFIIDPFQLMWGTYYGGGGEDHFNGMDADNNGNIFIAGYSSSYNFPVKNAGGGAYFQGTSKGGTEYGFSFGYGDMVILKFNNSGVQKWATYYGGTGDDYATALCTDNANNVYVTGFSYGSNFPTQNPGAGAYYESQGPMSPLDFSGAVIVKFNNSGVRQWATYYNGDRADYATSAAVDASDNLFVAGYTASSVFPTMDPGGGAYYQSGPSSVQGTSSDFFLLKFNSFGVRQWATLYGGHKQDVASGVATDNSGNIFLTGFTQSTDFPIQDPGGGAFMQTANAGGNENFIVKFSGTGALQWATYYGGKSDEYGGNAITSDIFGNIFMTGFSYGADLPTYDPGSGSYYQSTNAGNRDCIILKFSNSGVRKWATYYGGSGLDGANAIVTDQFGNVFVTGDGAYADFPVKDYACGSYFQQGGSGGPFVAKFTNDGVPTWSTSDGNTFGWGSGLAVDNKNCVFVSGNWSSSVSGSFLADPGAGAYYQSSSAGGMSEGFITKFCDSCLAIATNGITQNSCNGMDNGSVSLSVSGGSSPYKYLWLQNASTSASVSQLVEGSYSVIITDACFCQTKTLFSIKDSNIVASANDIQPNIICGNPPNGSASAAVSGGAPAYSYLWIPSGITDSLATGLLQGNYSVTVTDTRQCATTISLTVDSLVCNIEGLYVPNTFTPDADNVNDVFYVYGSDVQNFDVKIYDRWGQLVFSSSDIAKGWDGKYNGFLVQEDIYVCSIHCNWISGNSSNKTTHLTLIR